MLSEPPTRWRLIDKTGKAFRAYAPDWQEMTRMATSGPTLRDGTRLEVAGGDVVVLVRNTHLKLVHEDRPVFR